MSQILTWDFQVPNFQVAVAVPTIESLVFVWVQAKYREIPPIVLSGALGVLMAFIVCGRIVLKPIF